MSRFLAALVFRLAEVTLAVVVNGTVVLLGYLVF